MGLSSALLLVGFSAFSLPGAQSVSFADEDWDRVWNQAQSVLVTGSGVNELAEALQGVAPSLESEVADFLLASIRGEQPAFVVCEVLPALSPESAWAFSLALESGPALHTSLTRALETCSDADLSPVLERGFAEFMKATDARQVAVAVRLGESLHRRARAVWSAQNLAIAYTRHGDYRAAASCLIDVLAGQITEADRLMLESRLSLVQWGDRGLLGARASLGASLCKGNSDSGIILGLFSLERGQLSRAKALFRSVLGQDPAQPWARKGWGLSMVPH